MPTGVYPRSQKQLEVLDKGRRLPRTEKQIAACRRNGWKVGKLPNTSKKQIETCRKLGLAAKGKSNPHKGNIFGDTVVCHHNDLCRGTKRPDDVIYMNQREHVKLHSNLQVQNGTHPFLFLEEKPWKRKK